MPLSGVRALGVIGSIIAVRVSARMHVVFNQMIDWVSGSNWSYLVILGVAILDAFFPFVPSEIDRDRGRHPRRRAAISTSSS